MQHVGSSASRDASSLQRKLIHSNSALNRQAFSVSTQSSKAAEGKVSYRNYNPPSEDSKSRRSPGKQFLAETSHSPAIVLHEPDSNSLSSQFRSAEVNGSQSLTSRFSQPGNVVMLKRRILERIAVAKLAHKDISSDDTSENTPDSGSSR